MPTSPTPITSLPTAPSRADPANFATRADAFLGALGTFGTQTNALGSTTYNNAVEAATSATTAGTSASNAATSASNAAASATAAAGSATAAANSATSAAASYDAFDDRYLGSKAADPSVDNDGNALLTGALYWNTSANEMRVWNGSAWVVSYLPADEYLQLTGGALSGNLTLSAGTANGVTYLNGSKVLTTGSALTFDGTAVSLTTAASSFVAKFPGGVQQMALGSDGSSGAYIGTLDNYPVRFLLNSAEQMRLTSTGLGIGTSSPGAKLDVFGSGNIVRYGDGTNTFNVRFKGPNNWDQQLDTAADKFSIRRNSVDFVVVDSSGKLGIGTSSPSQNLEVSGSNAVARVSGTAGSVPQLSLSSAGVVNWSLRSNNDAASDFTIYQDSTPRLKIDSFGNLGIGTSSPVAKLDVRAAAGGIYLNSTTGTNQVALQTNNSGGDFYFGIDNSVGNNFNTGTAYAGVLWRSGANPICFVNNSTERMRLDSSGNLGIGTSSPGAKLDVTGTGLVSSFGSNTVAETYIQVKNGTSALYLGGASAYNYVYSTASIPLTFWTNGNEVGRFSADGTFRVKGAGTAGSTDAVQFSGSAPASAMTLDASSRLGIKQTSPTVDLDVGANDSTVAALSVRYSTVPAYLSNSFDGTVGLTTLSVNSYNTSSGSASWSAFQNTAYGNAAVQIASGTGGADIRFLTAAAANTNPTERARITSGGDLLVGTTTATSSGVKPLKINNATNPGIVTAYADTEKAYHYMPSATIWRGETVTGVAIEFSAGNSNGVSLASGGTSWTSLSDERKKDIIEPITDAANKISTLRAVIGKYKTDEEGIRRAFLIAQDVQKVLPEAVNATDPNSLGIQYTETIPLLVSAIQELKSELDSVKAELATLKGA